MAWKKFRPVATAAAVSAVWQDHIRATGGAAGLTVTLPLSAGFAGNEVIVEKVDAGVGVVTIAGSGAELIEGAATIGIAGQFSKVRLLSNGTGWDIVMDGRREQKNLPVPASGVALTVVESGVFIHDISAGADTHAQAIPTFVGQEITHYINADGGGTLAITFASAINAAGNTVATAQDVRDILTLRGVTVAGALAWEIVQNTTWGLA